MKHFLLNILGFLLVVPTAHAIVDTNENGMSDVWERHFNSGGLFPESFLAQDDPDGDGWNNATEAVAGTNPFEANATAGYLRPDFAHIPAVYSNPPGGGPPVTVTPEAITLSWPTINGKKYTLTYSSDLSVGSWQALASPFIGNGSVTQYGIPLTQPDGSTPDKLFWRVAVTDTDWNANGITDAEEYLLSVDDDHDGVPDEWERRISYFLSADYGISAPGSPAQFDVNANYGGIETSAALTYQNLLGDLDLTSTEVVASPSVEGSMKTIEQYKGGFLQFTQLPRLPIFQETGPVLNFFKTMSSKMDNHYARESLYTSVYFKWDEEFGHREKTETYSWNSSLGWSSSKTNGPQSWMTDNWIWGVGPGSTTPANRNWIVSGNSGLSLQTCEAYVSGSPPVLIGGGSGTVNGNWTSTTEAKRVGEGAYHSSGAQATKPNPGIGYQPTYKESETFTFTQELSDPYTTENMTTDALAKLAAATAVSQSPLASRNLVANESKISLKGGRYRLKWTIPSSTPVSPGNILVKAIFLWQEVTDPEATSPPSTSPGRMIAWKHESVSATPGTLAQTPWHDLPPPEKDGTSWVRPVFANGSITLPNAILVNSDDDDGNGQEDRKQASLSLGTENDLIAVNFEAVAPGADAKSLIYRLEATGAGKVRLWAAFPNQEPQRVALPYKLQTRDYIGGAGPRPTYYVEAIKGGGVSLKLHAEVLGQKLALVAKAEVQSLDISIDFAANMKGVIGDLVPSNRAGSNAVHFVTTKSASSADAVILTANGISGDQITPQHANQLVEWVGAVPVPGNLPTTKIPRSSTGKYPVSIRLLSTGQTTSATNVWVTWADLELRDDTPRMRPSDSTPDDFTLRALIKHRYTCHPHEMFDLTQDIPNFNLPPNPPVPGNHAWPPHAPLADGAAIQYDATRQVRAVMRSSDSALLNSEHAHAPDIPDYPADIGIGNDDPEMNLELLPYQGPSGSQGAMAEQDAPHYKLANDLGAPNSTFQLNAQFRQYARVQIAGKWYQCSDLWLSDLNFRFKKNATTWSDDNSSFVIGNGTFPPP